MALTFDDAPKRAPFICLRRFIKAEVMLGGILDTCLYLLFVIENCSPIVSTRIGRHDVHMTAHQNYLQTAITDLLALL